jgi:hypothetical protein
MAQSFLWGETRPSIISCGSSLETEPWTAISFWLSCAVNARQKGFEVFQEAFGDIILFLWPV